MSKPIRQKTFKLKFRKSNLKSDSNKCSGANLAFKNEN